MPPRRGLDTSYGHNRAKRQTVQKSSSSSSSSTYSASDTKSSSKTNIDDNWVGIINKKFTPKKLIENSGKLVTSICRNKYGMAPKLKIDGHVNATFVYMPLPVEYIIPELLKNAFRATVEHAKFLNNFSIISFN